MRDDRSKTRARVARFLAAVFRVLFLAALLAGYAAALLWAPVRAQVPAPLDLDRHERALALALARVSFNEGGASEPDGELVAQVVLGHGETARERLSWLRHHSRCVAGNMTQDAAYRRPGICRWTRNAQPDGRRPRGWRRDLDGPWSRTRPRWRTVLERAIAYVRGERIPSICPERPLSWDGVRYGRERVAPEGSRRRILDCREPYTADPARRGLHNFAVTWLPAPSPDEEGEGAVAETILNASDDGGEQ